MSVDKFLKFFTNKPQFEKKHLMVSLGKIFEKCPGLRSHVPPPPAEQGAAPDGSDGDSGRETDRNTGTNRMDPGDEGRWCLGKA